MRMKVHPKLLNCHCPELECPHKLPWQLKSMTNLFFSASLLGTQKGSKGNILDGATSTTSSSNTWRACCLTDWDTFAKKGGCLSGSFVIQFHKRGPCEIVDDLSGPGVPGPTGMPSAQPP